MLTRLSKASERLSMLTVSTDAGTAKTVRGMYATALQIMQTKISSKVNWFQRNFQQTHKYSCDSLHIEKSRG